MGRSGQLERPFLFVANEKLSLLDEDTNAIDGLRKNDGLAAILARRVARRNGVAGGLSTVFPLI